MSGRAAVQRKGDVVLILPADELISSGDLYY